MAMYQGNLIVGGYFVATGEELTSGLAMWNGTNWQAFNGGVDGYVNALLVEGEYMSAVCFHLLVAFRLTI